MRKFEFSSSEPPCLNEVICEVDCDFECNLEESTQKAFIQSIRGKGLTRSQGVERLIMQCQVDGCSANCVVLRAKENECLVVDEIGIGPYLSDDELVKPLDGCLRYPDEHI